MIFWGFMYLVFIWFFCKVWLNEFDKDDRAAIIVALTIFGLLTLRG